MMPDNKKFGLTLGPVTIIGALVLFFYHYIFFAQTIFIVGIMMICCALFRPSLLRYPNFLWMKLGIFLHIFISPLVLGTIFFLLVTPLAIFLNLIGRDELRLKRNCDTKTFWETGNIDEVDENYFRNQF